MFERGGVCVCGGGGVGCTLSWEDHFFDGAKVRGNLKQWALPVFETSLGEAKF